MPTFNLCNADSSQSKYNSAATGERLQVAALPSVGFQVVLASKSSRAPGAGEAAWVEVLLHVAPEVGYVLDGCST